MTKNREALAMLGTPLHLDALLLDVADQLLGFLSPEGILVRANRALVEFCGRPESQLIQGPFWSGPWWSRYGIGSRSVRKAFARAAAGDAVQLAGTMGSGADGRVELVFKRAPGVAGSAASVTVTGAILSPDAPRQDRRSACDDDLRRELSEIQQIYEHTPVGLCVLDRDYRFLRVNPQLASMSGVAAEDHIGRSLREVLPDLADTLEALCQPVMDAGDQVEGFTLWRKLGDGRQFHRKWTINIYPFRAETGEILGAIAAVSEVTALARAEHAREERERQLRAFFDSAPAGMFLLDRQLRYLRVNQPLADIHGLSVAEHLGRPLADVSPANARLIERVFGEFRRGAPPLQKLEFSGEYPGAPDTTGYWIAICFPITDSSGGPTGLGGMVIDVTERKRIERALRRRKRELRKAQKLARLGHWELSVDTGEIRWSDEMYLLAGYSAEQAPSSYEGFASILGENSWQRLDALVQQAVLTGVPFELDVEVARPDGERLWFTIQGETERDPGGRVTRLHGIAQDITERKLTELALRDSERRFQQAFVHAPLGMEIVDAEGRLVRVNPALCRLLGYDEGELLGMTLFELYPQEEVEQRFECFRQLIDGQVASYELEERHVRKDGRILWILATRTQLKSETGGAPYVIAQLLDITERKRTSARILRLSRLYAALSVTNEALLRRDTPEEVYRAVCEACVAHGGFRLAWIGVADPDAQRIVPIEAAGPAVGFLDDRVISTSADEPAGQGPAGQAYREQRLVESIDLMKNLDHAWIHAAAAAYGLVSVIALPLCRRGTPFGILSVASGEELFLDDEMKLLLQKMADNISFALDLYDREWLRERTEAALRASEARLQEAQALSRMGDWELDRDSGTMTWSPQLFHLFERPIGLGTPDLNEALAYYTPESLEHTRERFWHAIDTGERSELEQVVELPSGRRRYHAAVIVPVKAPSGRVTKLYGTVQDITERKLAEDELMRKSAEIEDLYQNAPCGYHSLDAEARIVRINDTELGWLGYTRDEVIGKMAIYDLLGAESQAAFASGFAKFKRTGVLRGVEMDLRRKDGSLLPVLVSSSAIFDAAGKFVSSRTVLSDNTYRKQLEQERAAHMARLASLSQRLVEVQENERRQLAGELHDRASPNLAALQITFSNLSTALPADVLAEVEPLLDDAQALLMDTTAGIREICTDLRPATLDYAGLVPALRDYAQHFGQRTGIEVLLDGDDFRVQLPSNVQSLLFRIAQEALTNCAKHALARMIRVRLAETEGTLTMTISDDGVGFDATLLGEGGSTPGLGLITMKERAEFAGGRFQVRSHPGEGTEIVVTFDHPTRSAKQDRRRGERRRAARCQNTDPRSDSAFENSPRKP